MAKLKLPQPDLAHLMRMTDDTGVLQHAVYATPDREPGYATDDNARALVAAIMFRKTLGDDSCVDLAQTYLAFLFHAFNPATGRFRNFMSYDRRWLEDVGSEDSHGRTLAALGVTASLGPSQTMAILAEEMLVNALPATRDFKSPRGCAFAVAGIDSYLERFGGDDTARAIEDELASRVLDLFERNSSPDWPWCENLITYSNGNIVQALIQAGTRLGNAKMTAQGLRSLAWLMKVETGKAGRLSVIGNEGWMKREGSRAQFDQQPVETVGLAEACAAAFRATGDKRWKTEATRCAEWFLGRNDLGVTLYDKSTGGCRDGLGPETINPNCGAESTLAWLITLGTMREL